MAVIDRDAFKASFPRADLSGKALTPEREEGFDAIFDAWDGFNDARPLGGLAYALATAWHETGARMQPVREGFKHTDAEAFNAVTAYCAQHGKANYAKREANGNSYYGRGYVQITFGDNYRKLGQHLGLGDTLYDAPDDVMQPAIGARILLVGMTEGLFRRDHGKLADYFDGNNARWFEARDLINGDKEARPTWADGKRIGDLCSDYGRGFAKALRYA